MKHNHLKDINGMQIRRQYFNFPVCIFLSILLLCVEVFTFIPLFNGNFSFGKWVEDIFASVSVNAMFMVPCIVLSVLNRFFFGKIVCVLNQEGIHHKGGLVRWDDILFIRHNVTVVGKRYFRLAYAEVVCKNKIVEIKSAPMYLLSAAKQFNADIKTKCDSLIWITIGMIVIAGIVVPAVA